MIKNFIALIIFDFLVMASVLYGIVYMFMDNDTINIVIMEILKQMF